MFHAKELLENFFDKKTRSIFSFLEIIIEPINFSFISRNEWKNFNYFIKKKIFRSIEWSNVYLTSRAYFLKLIFSFLGTSKPR